MAPATHPALQKFFWNTELTIFSFLFHSNPLLLLFIHYFAFGLYPLHFQKTWKNKSTREGKSDQEWERLWWLLPVTEIRYKDLFPMVKSSLNLLVELGSNHYRCPQGWTLNCLSTEGTALPTCCLPNEAWKNQADRWTAVKSGWQKPLDKTVTKLRRQRISHTILPSLGQWPVCFLNKL